MNHVLYGFMAGYSHRHRLAKILRDSPDGVSTDSVAPQNAKEAGIRVLALDFDGVLAPHGRPEPIPEAAEWLARCTAVFGVDRIYILSNKPTALRGVWFAARFPGIRFISGVRKKPFPDGLQKVVELSGAAPEEVMLLDDRLLTGVLATCLAGTGVTYINRPYTDVAGNPVKEIFFATLRTIERILIRLVPIGSDERRDR
jgi:predicted HAD superfamily phosphohydrolase YqeG